MNFLSGTRCNSTARAPPLSILVFSLPFLFPHSRAPNNERQRTDRRCFYKIQVFWRELVTIKWSAANPSGHTLALAAATTAPDRIEGELWRRGPSQPSHTAEHLCPQTQGNFWKPTQSIPTVAERTQPCPFANGSEEHWP